MFSLEGNNSTGESTDYMETQAQNLQSDELALEVIRKLHLDQNPDFGGNPKAISRVSSQASEVAVPLTPAENKALLAFQQSRKIKRDAASRVITVGMAAHNPLAGGGGHEHARKHVYRTRLRAAKQRHLAIVTVAAAPIGRYSPARGRFQPRAGPFRAAKGISTIGDNQNRFSDQMLELSRQLVQAQADRIQLQSYLSQGDDARKIRPKRRPRFGMIIRERHNRARLS